MCVSGVDFSFLQILEITIKKHSRKQPLDESTDDISIRSWIQYHGNMDDVSYERRSDRVSLPPVFFKATFVSLFWFYTCSVSVTAQGRCSHYSHVEMRQWRSHDGAW